MKPPAIHQFHAGSAYGDAITNGMLLIRRILTEFELESNIYVERVAPELEQVLNPHTRLKPEKDDILLIHHSMGHDLTRWILDLPGRKILIYHNITPAGFFPDDSPARFYSDLGRDQLKTFLPVMEAAICDSLFNAQELQHIGYTNVRVIPLLCDTNALWNHHWDHTIVSGSSNRYTILFVGRICPNKCQNDLITIAEHLKTLMDRPFQLVLVGGYAEIDPYYRKLADQVQAAGLSRHVRFTGKIPDEALYAWYRAADVFVCMSEHEGFGVPLIEAMAFDIPVLAFKSSNIPHTMGGAGILITEKDHRSIAALISLLSRDRAMKRALMEDQQRHAACFTKDRLSVQLADFLSGIGVDLPALPAPAQVCAPARLMYQVEGPFETSYSLALVNRCISLALERKHPGKAALFATEGPGDYIPYRDALAAMPEVENLWKRGKKAIRAGVVIRNLYPPRVADMKGQINLLYFAWEESMLPFEWTRNFNHHLDGLPVLSRFIQKILIDNGVSLPTIAAGCGIDHIRNLEPIPAGLKIKTGYKFLHISSCFPRKGVDLLLEAFARTFTEEDDTGLVIKTFPNIHHSIEDEVAALKEKYPQCPPIEIINTDLSPSHIAGLYEACDALVAPSRGEGFGLPLAEAMVHKIPVITTAYGGQSDFCTPETAWLIDFSFQSARTHLNRFDSVWMEPDPDHLAALMHEVRFAGPEALAPRLTAAHRMILDNFTWDRCVDRLTELEQKIRCIPPLSEKQIRLGWISSWHTRCGIAAYSQFLVQALPDHEFCPILFASRRDDDMTPDPGTFPVHRCWTDCREEIDMLLETLATERLDALVLQYNFAFFRPEQLERIIDFAKDRGMVIIIFFHATKDVEIPGLEASLKPAAPSLARADRLLVHGIEDLNRLKSWGLYENTAIFPHGVINRRPAKPLDTGKTVIAGYGFMLPHKGLEQLIMAFAELKKNRPVLHLLMVNSLYPNPVSDATQKQCMDLIRENDLQASVTLVTDFLTDEESLSLLASATLIVFPYQATSESSSAAVRHGLATHCPVACTPLEIFSDVSDCVHFLPGTTAREIAAGIDQLLLDPARLGEKQEAQDQWLASHSWNILGERLAGMIKGLIQG